MPYHWAECNTLVASDLDPISKIPGFKYTAVRIDASGPEVVDGAEHVIELDAL